MLFIIGKTRECADLPRGQGWPRRQQPGQREAIGDNTLTPPHWIGTKGQNWAGIIRHGKQRQIALHIHPRRHGGGQGAAIGGADGNRVAAINHVMIGQHPVARHDKTRPGGSAPAACCWRRCAGGGGGCRGGLWRAAEG